MTKIPPLRRRLLLRLPGMTTTTRQEHTMTTTTQITTTDILDINAWFHGDSTIGDPFDGFDMDTIRTEWHDAVQATASRLIGHDLTIARNGAVFGSYDERDDIRAAMESYEEGFWEFVAESTDLESIARRHQS